MGREDGKPAFDPFPRRKNKFNIEGPIGTLSDIKLIRTDTTLDHSQKAEKQRKKRKILGRNSVSNMSLFYSAPFRALLVGPLLSLSFPFFAFSLSFIPLLSYSSLGSSLRSEGIGLWRVVGREDFGKMEEVDTESILCFTPGKWCPHLHLHLHLHLLLLLLHLLVVGVMFLLGFVWLVMAAFFSFFFFFFYVTQISKNDATHVIKSAIFLPYPPSAFFCFLLFSASVIIIIISFSGNIPQSSVLIN